MSVRYECVICKQAVITSTGFYGGTEWIHEDGYRECYIQNFAIPNFNKAVN